MNISLIILLIIVILCLLRVWTRRSKKDIKLPPGIDGALPLIGIAHKFFGDSQRKYFF